MTDDTPAVERRRFRRTLLRVVTIQLITLLVLWWLQSRYGVS